MTVSDACKTTYEEIKREKKHRYVIFFIKDEKQIDVEVVGARDEEYDQFLTNLQAGGAGECRYGLYDFEYTHQCQGTSEASKKQKLFLMSWCPDTAKVKKKMLYSRFVFFFFFLVDAISLRYFLIFIFPALLMLSRKHSSVYRSTSRQQTCQRPAKRP